MDVPVNEILYAEVQRRGPGAQSALAHEVGVTEATMSRWVNGSQIPGEGWALPIAEATERDEASILAAIGLAKQLRAQAKKTRSAVSETEALQRVADQLIEQMAELRREVEDLRRQQRQPPPGVQPGSQPKRRGSR